MGLSKNAILLLKKRYCHQKESPKDVFRRVASVLSLSDEKFEKKLYNAMAQGYFLPNSPCLRNAGMKRSMLHACFKLPIEDDISSIFETVKNTAIIFHYGGGVGINFSKLRPRDWALSSGGTSSGALSFMEIFDKVTESVKQGGFRRGALLGVLNYSHPEIFDFTRKKLSHELQNFNISVLLTNEFMEKVKNDEMTDLVYKKEVCGTIRAKDLFDTISFCAWSSGDPGLIFYDRINQDNPFFKDGLIIDGCNPCGEVPLFDYGACCLGSLNLSKFITKDKFNARQFMKYTELAARALLNMNAVSWYPLQQITKNMKEYNPIGVGIMGFADALIKLGIYYDSEEALKFIDEVAVPYKEATEKLAKKSFYKRIIAPTGSLSILADCSPSIEPIFETTFERHLTVGVIQETREIYKSKYVRTAHKVSPEWHVRIQAKWQDHIDGAVSKTINCPSNTSIAQIRDIYYKAWEMGLKGITIFRDGCRGQQHQVLQAVKKEEHGKCEGETCHL